MLTDGEENTSTETPSTEMPPVSDDSQARLLTLYETGMQEARQRADRLERQLAQMQQAPAKVEEPPMDNNAFWQDSAKNIERIVEKALDARIKPLTDFVAETRGTTRYEQIKTGLRSNPGFRDKMEQIEPYLDEVMRTTEVTEANVNTAALSIIGALATGQLKAPDIKRPAGSAPPNPQNPSNAKNDAPMMPAHLRPSGPSITPTAPKKERRELTELEERIRREQKMTKDEYLDELEDQGPMVIESLMPRKKEAPNDAAKK
jgi:hypothetical protein